MKTTWLLTGAIACAACSGDGGRAEDNPAPVQRADAGPDAATRDAAPDAAPADAAASDAHALDLGTGDALPADALPADVGLADLGPRPTYAQCFEALGTADLGPDYEQFGPVLGHHCMGTDHQTIEGIERVVFLGDSVTAGTPPTRPNEFYRVLVADGLRARFGEQIEVANCSAFGARTDDFLEGKREVERCFPETPDARRTLVLFTIGGNDIAAWAQDQLTLEQALEKAREAADLLDDTIRWFKEPGRFPNGVYVVYANPYEYTDATGDLESCELARAGGFQGNWIQGAPAVVYFQERFMQTAVAHGVDLIFTLEHFCGHGFHHDDPASPCYRGPDAELWFDLTCIHPNPTGHRVIADMFLSVVDQ